MRSKWISLLALLVPVLPGLAQAPKVSVAGMIVVWDDMGEKIDGYKTFNESTGMKLALAVDSPAGRIIEVDEPASKVASVTDDRGNDLKGELGSFPKIAEDGSCARFELETGQPPANGATKVAVKGTVVLKVGGKQSEVATKPVELKEGTMLVFGDRLELTISKAGKPEWGDDPLRIEVTAARELDLVAEVRFSDAEGNAIESQAAGSSTMRSSDKVTTNLSYSLKKMVEKAVVTVVFWDDLKKVEVPYDLTIGLGQH